MDALADLEREFETQHFVCHEKKENPYAIHHKAEKQQDYQMERDLEKLKYRNPHLFDPD